MPLGERAERAIEWMRDHVPGTNPGLAALERESTAGGTLIAGGLAYRLFFWLVPFGLVVASIASFWERADPKGLESSAKRFGLGAAAARTATDAIEEGAHERWYYLIFGLVLLQWFAMGVVRAMRLAHAVAWGTGRLKLRRPIQAGILFTLLAAAMVAVSSLAQLLRAEHVAGGIVLTFAVVLFYGAIALWMMMLLPHRDAPWTALLPGAVLVAVGLECLHLFGVLYLAPRIGRSSELYGSLGAATVILLWLYIIARLITASAFLNATLWERRQSH
jgi:uncharacterized BrkB/YihY/UPF0761 family membrane protein